MPPGRGGPVEQPRWLWLANPAGHLAHPFLLPAGVSGLGSKSGGSQMRRLNGPEGVTVAASTTGVAGEGVIGTPGVGVTSGLGYPAHPAVISNRNKNEGGA